MEKLFNLETKTLTLSFDETTGSLISVYAKPSAWFVLKRAHLGLSWRFMLPLDGKRNNNAWGHLQKTEPICTCTDTSVKFHWPQIDSEFGGTHNIAVTTECRIVDDQAVFYMHIDNQDSVFVENVFYPYLGDLYRPDGARSFRWYKGGYFNTNDTEIWPTFPNYPGTHSVETPTIYSHGADGPPFNPFCLFADEKGNGFYLGAAERRVEATIWHGEALPGWRNSNDYRLFTEDSFEGKDVFARFCVGHLPFVAPGTSFDVLPFGMEAYTGSWADGTNCYTRVSKKWSKLPNMPEWAKNPHSWLQVHINSPEDELRIKFKDLPILGRECVKYGIEAIQLVGWNDGGQDRGNPSHDPDPRLGTFDELKQAIQEIRDMGVKLILFAKFTWADQSHPQFKEIYEPLSVKDPYGNYYIHQGYQYMTISQLSNVTTRRLIPMCFHSDTFMDICRAEFQKCIDLGADGILYDENHHHAHTLCCFDTNHGHRYGESSYSADERLIDMFREMVKGKEFLIAGEASYDFQLNYYDVSYARTWGRGHRPFTRMVRPNANLMTAVVGFNDRSMINQCLLNRYIISFEPYNFKGVPSDYPQTAAYGRKMDDLRNDLRAYFWDGQYCDKIGGAVLADGVALDSYAVYDSTNGAQGMVICNYDEENSITVTPTLASGQKLTKFRLVDDTDMKQFDGSFVIPPMSAAAVI